MVKVGNSISALLGILIPLLTEALATRIDQFRICHRQMYLSCGGRHYGRCKAIAIDVQKKIRESSLCAQRFAVTPHERQDLIW